MRFGNGIVRTIYPACQVEELVRDAATHRASHVLISAMRIWGAAWENGTQEEFSLRSRTQILLAPGEIAEPSVQSAAC